MLNLQSCNRSEVFSKNVRVFLCQYIRKSVYFSLPCLPCLPYISVSHRTVTWTGHQPGYIPLSQFPFETFVLSQEVKFNLLSQCHLLIESFVFLFFFYFFIY